MSSTNTPSEESYMATISTAALKGAGLALVAGGIVAFAGPKYPAYQQMSRGMRLFLLGTGTAATAVSFGDHARVQYEDRQLLRHLSAEEADAKRAEIRAQRGAFAETMHKVRENKTTVVGVAWLSCMAGSLGYTFTRKGLTTSQRIVQARMYAQGFTVLVMMAVAALEMTEGPSEEPEEVLTDQWKAIMAMDDKTRIRNIADGVNPAVKSAAAASLSTH
ncbi:hypothetical protein DFQ27_008549 [Actinomortierella ambigua]|uniref:HIG1 domain-containing protein n=1 Tax=Actinomortierella ambigua TaxID=1343610 RepID=A0A9P6UBF1_9FUNG|nr:hypothetical protein DFQ27_008549 [Actinomortierella ambigua]